jgi:hypothetical protein
MLTGHGPTGAMGEAIKVQESQASTGKPKEMVRPKPQPQSNINMVILKRTAAAGLALTGKPKSLQIFNHKPLSMMTDTSVQQRFTACTALSAQEDRGPKHVTR